jgi:transcriptional regulator with XRE-family HTH domain
MAASDEERDVRSDARRELRDFLATRRNRITPGQAGLPTYGGERRRVPGLRREEVALLAGVSTDYYTRLERGSATGVSESVIEGVARALQLDEAEHSHLLALIRTSGSSGPPRRRPSTRQQVRPTVQRVVDSMVDTPAFVSNGRLDVLYANALGRALFAPVFAFTQPNRPPSNARFVFLDPAARDLFRQWDAVADDTVALLRAEAGRDPHDRQLSDRVGELAMRSTDFRSRWARHDVRIHTSGVKLIHHPVVGDLDLPYESFPVPSEPTLSLVTYTAEPASRSAEALGLLASWTTTNDLVDRTTSEQGA